MTRSVGLIVGLLLIAVGAWFVGYSGGGLIAVAGSTVAVAGMGVWMASR